MGMNFAIVPIIGSGTRGDPYRADVSGSHSAHIPTDEQGRPLGNEALVVMDTADSTFDLDLPMSALPMEMRSKIDERLSAEHPRGVDRRLSAGEALRQVAANLEPGFTMKRLREMR